MKELEKIPGFIENINSNSILFNNYIKILKEIEKKYYHLSYVIQKKINLMSQVNLYKLFTQLIAKIRNNERRYKILIPYIQKMKGYKELLKARL